MLTPEQRRFWFSNGFLHLPGFFDSAAIDAALDVHDRAWNENLPIAVDDMDTGERCAIADVPPSKRRGRYKLNDLYLQYPEILNLGMAPKLVKILEQLLVDRPVLINSLDVDFGTAQTYHVDSLFMTPSAPYNLAAAWVALEDGHEDSGPLHYYPGSHQIWPYKFSTGKNHIASDEMEKWKAYMDEQIAAFGLSPTYFLPKKGDVFFWHSYLLHAGGKINDKKRTRKTSIFHYFSESDVKLAEATLVPHNGGFWHKKEPIFEHQIQTAYQQAQAGELPPAPAMSKVEKLARTTLHHLRGWRRDIGEQWRG